VAANREGAGLAALRLALGVFMLFEGLGKLNWLVDSTPLRDQLQSWLQTAWSANRWYLSHVAIPGAGIFARLVVSGETACGLALILGTYTRLAATLGLLMVLNFHFASGAMFQYRFLTNGYGLPVLGSLLALAIGGGRLPLSLKK
jgi:uncharacterized membrane protein YphA (DoxX/SURF4 family)